MTPSLKKSRVLIGFLWNVAEKTSVQVFSFAVVMVLANLITPKEFGIVTILSTLSNVIQRLKDGGTSVSILRSKTVDERELSSIFFFTIFLGVFFSTITFSLAGQISNFFKAQEATIYLRSFSLIFFIESFSVTSYAVLSRNLEFKKQFKISFLASIVSGVVGILLAVLDYGIWSIIIMNLAKSIILAVSYGLVRNWKICWSLSWADLSPHLNFGYKLTISSLINGLFDNIYRITIGRVFSLELMAFYDRAKKMQELPVKNISQAINKSTFPEMSKVQDDKLKLRKIYNETITNTFYFLCPFLLLGSVYSEDIILIVLNKDWLESAKIFRIVCLSGLFYPIHSFNLSIVNVVGRSDWFLKIDIIKKVFVLIFIYFLVDYGLYAILYFQLISSILFILINSFYPSKILNVGLIELLKPLTKPMILFIVSFVFLYVLNKNFRLSIPYMNLLLGSVYAIAIYISLTFLLKMPIRNRLKIYLKF